MGTKKESNQVHSMNIEHHTSAINRMPIKVLIIERERETERRRVVLETEWEDFEKHFAT